MLYAMRLKKHLKAIIIVSTIIVGASIVVWKYSNQGAQNTCHDSDSFPCYREQISYTLEHQGINQTYELITRLYGGSSGFASTCHEYTHFIGEQAYRKFKRDKSLFIIPQKAYYCGYGFFHGFLEQLLQETGDLEQARKFCTVARVEGSPHSESACYHGIGHGVAADGIPENYASSEDYLDSALALCEQVGDNYERKKLCSSGAYNALAIVWQKSNNLFLADRRDPYAFCAQEIKPYFREACFHQMNTFIYDINRGDMVKAMIFVEAIPNTKDAVAAMEGLATHFGAVRARQGDFNAEAAICQGLQERVRSICVTGFVSGVLEKGTPEKEYADAERFCKSTELTASFRDKCFQRLASSFPLWYPHEKASAICETIPEKYRLYCSI